MKYFFCLLFVFIWIVRFGFVINVYSLKGFILLFVIRKGIEWMFKEFEGVGEDNCWKVYENDEVMEYC